MIYIGTTFMLGVLASSTLVLEKRDRTLKVLLTTAIEPSRIIWAKAVGLCRYLAIPYLVAFLLLYTGLRERDQGMLLWCLAYVLFVTGVAFQASMRASKQTFALGITIVIALLPIFLAALLRRPLGREVVGLIFPPAGRWQSEPILVSSCLYLCSGYLALWQCGATLRDHCFGQRGDRRA